MGGTTDKYSGRWTDNDYTSYRGTVANKSIQQVFTQRSIHESMNPYDITIRESCDSTVNPNATAVIIGLDVTGSMGRLAYTLATEGLGKLVKGIIDQRPVTDPHIMVMGIGDCDYDRAPLQVSQFEPDIRIAEQLTNIYIEGGGGGNGWESYDLPWWFAANKTAIDCFSKRNQKGYLFTIGDEPPPQHGLSQHTLKKVFGNGVERGYSIEETLKSAQERYNVFHIILERAGHCASAPTTVIPPWRKLLGARAILLSDANYLPEVILAVMNVSEGADPEIVLTKISDPSIRTVVRHALVD